MLYVLNLDNYKNLRFVLTNKYLIFINKNGILKFNINFFNIYVKLNKLYIDLNNYKFFNRNLELFFVNKYLLLSNNKNVNLKKYSANFLTLLYINFYYLVYPFSLTINLKGVGFKFIIEDNILKLRIGFSHLIFYKLDPDIYFVLKSPTVLILYSNNYYNLKKVASVLKSYKKVNLYKGTGIFYDDEFIILKKKNTKNESK